jgi:hypothetical protein
LFFTPGVPVNVQECAGDPADGNCDYANSTQVTPQLHGDFALTFPVHRDLAPGFAPPGTLSTDCAATAGACSIVVSTTRGDEFSKPISFAKSTSAVTPSMSLSQATNLTENKTVRVTLHGFAPARPIQIIECSAAARTGDFSQCDQTITQVTSAPAGVAPVTSIAVHRTVSSLFGFTDCTAKPGACVLIAMPAQFGGLGGSLIVGIGVGSGSTGSGSKGGVAAGGGTGVAGLLDGVTIAGATPSSNHLSPQAAARLHALTGPQSLATAGASSAPLGDAVVPLSFKP